MNLVQSKKSIAKLKKVRNIVGVSKFLTLQEISKATKISKNALEVSALARDIFVSAHKKYHLNLNYIKASSKGVKLYIYITFPKSLLSSSYERIEKELLKEFKHGQDKLITVGPIAESFAKKHHIETEYHLDSFDAHSIQKVSALVSHLFDTKKVSQVNYVLQTQRNDRGILTILPVSLLNIESTPVEDKIVSKYKFYPSLVETMENIQKIYVLQNTTAIFHEAQYFYLKEKLLRHEESLTNIDEKIIERSREVIKLQRKIQTEELILISQNVKRNSNGGK